MDGQIDEGMEGQTCQKSNMSRWMLHLKIFLRDKFNKYSGKDKSLTGLYRDIRGCMLEAFPVELGW